MFLKTDFFCLWARSLPLFSSWILLFSLIKSMNNFHFAKIIAGVWPILAKETILSKVINMVDVFRISLSQGFDDNNKKYIDTILKLDNSKTIMFETKWTDVRVKNMINVHVKKDQKIVVDYSEYAQENIKKVFVDYAFLWQIPAKTKIVFEQSWVEMQIEDNWEDFVNCKVLKWWEIMQYDRVIFENYDMKWLFLTEKDKKDILRGLEYGVHMIAASDVKSKDEILLLKVFMKEQNWERMKILAKIENKEALENLDELIEVSDWIIVVFDKIASHMKSKKITQEDIISKCKERWKPVVVSFSLWLNTKDYELFSESNIKKYCWLSVDGYMLETMISEQDPLEMITKVSEMLDTYELKVKEKEIEPFYEKSDFDIRDYIIFNSYRTTKELNVKAIVCYTENGYTASRLSSLNPKVPIITFTKFDETYRYLNMLLGVRWYKISQSFNYENLKRIWKEMIRVTFKWNISLDDKIIIVQATEWQKNEKTDMINWIEIYSFKNI